MIVAAKITAGWHPDHGDIIAGKTYDITGEIPAELFDIPEPVPTEETEK